MTTPIYPETGQPYWHLTAHCPKCATAGVIPWDRFDRVFSCRACATWYRMDGGGHLVPTEPPAPAMNVAVRSAFSDWNEHRLAQQRGLRFSFWRRRGAGWLTAPLGWLLLAGWQTRAVLVVCLLGLLASVCWIANRSPAAPAMLGPLPSTLEERAPLLAAAWISRDTAAMRRLVMPENSRELQHWSARSLRPSALATVDPGDLTFETVSVVRQPDPKWAVATVRVACRAPSDSASTKPVDFVQRQVWNQHNGVWFFCPRDEQPQQQAAQSALGRYPVPVPRRRR